MNNQISQYTKNYLLKHGQLEAQMLDQPTYRDKVCSWIIKYLSRNGIHLPPPKLI
jgi:hypothetical protein